MQKPASLTSPSIASQLCITCCDSRPTKQANSRIVLDRTTPSLVYIRFKPQLRWVVKKQKMAAMPCWLCEFSRRPSGAKLPVSSVASWDSHHIISSAASIPLTSMGRSVCRVRHHEQMYAFIKAITLSRQAKNQKSIFCDLVNVSIELTRTGGSNQMLQMTQLSAVTNKPDLHRQVPSAQHSETGPGKAEGCELCAIPQSKRLRH